MESRAWACQSSALFAEVDALRDAATHVLHPHVHAWEVRREVSIRHDDLRGERFVVAVAGPIKVRLEHDHVFAGEGSLERLGLGAGALERRAVQERGGVPPDSLAGEAW